MVSLAEAEALELQTLRRDLAASKVALAEAQAKRAIAHGERAPNRRRLLACYIAAWVLEVAKNAACSRAASRRANALALPLLACVLFGMRPERQAPWVVRFLRGEDGHSE